MKLEMKIKSPKFFFKNGKRSTDSDFKIDCALAKNFIQEGSLRFWNLVALIIERDRKK